MNSLLADERSLKIHLRQKAYAARNAQPDKNNASRVICQTIQEMPEYLRAQTILWYIHCRSEVRTLRLYPEILTGNQHKTIAIPYCTVDQHDKPALGLWRLTDLHELEPGTWGILEPPKPLWHDACRQILPGQIDLVVVPGVGFDCQGGRLGNGKGYYDNMLATLRQDVVLVGAGYESQLFDSIPMSEHDIYMDLVVTEKAVYYGKGKADQE